jgi:segregation and condensation protein B
MADNKAMRLVRDEPMLEEEEEENASAPVDGAVEEPQEIDDADDSKAADIDPRPLEALLLATHHPLTKGRLAELMDLQTTGPIRRAIQKLNAVYAETNRSFRIEQVAGGYQILTLPEFGDHLKKLHQREIDAKLTKAALETLAIIAYKQPILRADIESIRGVACGETVRNLMENILSASPAAPKNPAAPSSTEPPNDSSKSSA